MKVGLVCPYDLGALGGVQNQVSTLAGWLQEEGHDAVIVGPGESGPQGAVLVGPVTVVPANGAATPIRLDPRVAGAVAEAVADCDVVHIHEPLMPAVSLGAMMRAAPPIVATFHADPPPWVVRTYGMAGRLVRRLLQRAAVVTAVSPVAGRAVPGISPELIPNGIDTRLYPDLPAEPGRVVFVGRNDPRKGLSTLLEAWPAVVAASPSARLHVVGSEAIAGAPSDVVFHGRVDEDAKRRALASSAVLCAPNTRGESFGVVLVEGMAAGCAIVASALPGFVYSAGDAAVLVPPADPDALAAALTSLLTDAATCDRFASAARARVQRFDRAAVLAAYLATYEKAVAGGRPQRRSVHSPHGEPR